MYFCPFLWKWRIIQLWSKTVKTNQFLHNVSFMCFFLSQLLQDCWLFADPSHLDRDGPSINRCDKLRNTVSITVSQTRCDCATTVEDNFKIIPILCSWAIGAADVADLIWYDINTVCLSSATHYYYSCSSCSTAHELVLFCLYSPQQGELGEELTLDSENNCISDLRGESIFQHYLIFVSGSAQSRQ